MGAFSPIPGPLHHWPHGPYMLTTSGPVMPPHQAAAMPRPGMPQQHPHHPQAEVDASYAERAKSRRSRKPNDKNLPEGVENCIIEPDVAVRYKDLRELERRLDATMTRKRLEIIESVSRETKVRTSIYRRPETTVFDLEVKADLGLCVYRGSKRCASGSATPSKTSTGKAMASALTHSTYQPTWMLRTASRSKVALSTMTTTPRTTRTPLRQHPCRLRSNASRTSSRR